MTNAERRLVRSLVSEEIRRLVADFTEHRGCLQAGRYAAQIARAYPSSGMSSDQIADDIIEAAVRARIVVEMSRPEKLPP